MMTAMRLIARLALLHALPSAGLPACTIGAEMDPPAATKRAPIEVFSWGGLQGEPVAEHERNYPQDAIIHANAQLSTTAHQVLRRRLLEGDPPDSFQVNVGAGLMQWVLVNQVDARESRLLPLDSMPGMSEWIAAWPPPLRAALSHDGQPYAVAANVHRMNGVFFNPKVLLRVGAKVPERLDELFALGEALAERGIPLLAIGSKDPWTLSVLIIESLLIAQHGPDFYEDYFTGRLDANDPRVGQTLISALRLLRYANANREQLYWEDAADMVFDGRAAMTVMGDWARTRFDVRGAELEAEYGEMAFPGTDAVFVFACNAFPLPIGARNEAGARRLLGSIASLQGQAAIARSRASIPARLDVAVNPDDPWQVEKQRLWRAGRLVLAQSGIVPPSFANDLNEALAQMDRERRVSPVVHTLRARYMLLGR